jgi:uncharacterized C2H2 Zn-finger protein
MAGNILDDIRQGLQRVGGAFGADSTAVVSEPKQAEFSCPYCGTVFPTQEELEAHIITEHGANAQVSNQALLEGQGVTQPSGVQESGAAQPAGGTYVCPYCGATFKTGNELDAHIQSVHLKKQQAVAGGVEEAQATLPPGYTAVDVYAPIRNPVTGVPELQIRTEDQYLQGIADTAAKLGMPPQNVPSSLVQDYNQMSDIERRQYRDALRETYRSLLHYAARKQQGVMPEGWAVEINEPTLNAEDIYSDLSTMSPPERDNYIKKLTSKYNWDVQKVYDQFGNLTVEPAPSSYRWTYSTPAGWKLTPTQVTSPEGQTMSPQQANDSPWVIDRISGEFNPIDVASLKVYAEDNPDQFLDNIKQAGNTPLTQAALKSMGMTDEETQKIFPKETTPWWQPGKAPEPTETSTDIVRQIQALRGEPLSGEQKDWLLKELARPQKPIQSLMDFLQLPGMLGNLWGQGITLPGRIVAGIGQPYGTPLGEEPYGQFAARTQAAIPGTENLTIPVIKPETGPMTLGLVGIAEMLTPDWVIAGIGKAGSKFLPEAVKMLTQGMEREAAKESVIQASKLSAKEAEKIVAKASEMVGRNPEVAGKWADIAATKGLNAPELKELAKEAAKTPQIAPKVTETAPRRVEVPAPYAGAGIMPGEKISPEMSAAFRGIAERELAKGTSAADVLRMRGSIPEAEATKIIRQVKSGVAQAAPKVIETTPAEIPPVQATNLVEAAKQKFTNVFDEINRATSETEVIRTKEMATKLAEADKIVDEKIARGEAIDAYEAARAIFRGKKPFELPIKPENQWTPQEAKALIEDIRSKPDFDFWSQSNLVDTLKDVMRGGRELPDGSLAPLQQNQLKLLSDYLGLKIPPKTGPKAIQWVFDILGIPKSLQASWDVSFPLRQGLALSGTKAWSDSWKPMMQSLASEQSIANLEKTIVQHPLFERMQRAGVSFVEMTAEGPLVSRGRFGGRGAMEEAFPSRIGKMIETGAEKVANALESKGMPPKATAAGKFLISLFGTRPSDRAFVSFGNWLRLNEFANTVKWLDEIGFKSTELTDKKLAAFINVATGRASVSTKTRNMMAILNLPFFSPQFMLSRLQLPIEFFKLPRPMMAKYAKDLAKVYGTLAGLTALVGYGAKMGFLPDNVSVENSPISTDFGKIKVGETRIDPWGGQQQYLVFMSRFLSGMTKATSSGVVTPLDRLDLFVRFTRTKMSPAVGTLFDWMAGKTIVGEEFIPANAADIIKNRMLSMNANDLWSGFEEGGMVGGSLSTLGTFGVGIQTYKTTNVQTFRSYINGLTFNEQEARDLYDSGNIAELNNYVAKHPTADFRWEVRDGEPWIYSDTARKLRKIETQIEKGEAQAKKISHSNLSRAERDAQIKALNDKIETYAEPYVQQYQEFLKESSNQ